LHIIGLDVLEMGSVGLLIIASCIFGFMVTVLIYKLGSYRRVIDNKNVKLIQYYLDAKFLAKHLRSNIDSSDPSVFCKSLIDDIKEYYNLEDVLIIDSINGVYSERNTVLRANILDFIANNFSFLEAELSKGGFVTLNTSCQGREYVLHLSSIILSHENDGVIVCVERSPSLLSENELLGLENIVNLLKTRLMYS
jgi:hypothetical protein